MRRLSVTFKDRTLIRRVIDANINRTKEGLRVCEEVTRFILGSHSLTTQLKRIRHSIDELMTYLPGSLRFIDAREVLGDIGRNIHIKELKRRGVGDIFSANMQRVKESIRVLEEFSKPINHKAAIGFKKLRYAVYELEKRTAQKISSLYHHR